MSFPLYTILSDRHQEGGEIDLVRSVAAIADIKCSCTKEDAQEHYDQITALAIHHWVLTNPGKPIPAAFPYPHKTVHHGEGLMIEMRNLPPALQGAIAMYPSYYGQ